MQLWHLFSVIWICVVLTGTTAKQCVKTSSGEGRRCRKACVKDFDCKAPKKTCNCDGECGMSCYNMDAVCGESDSIQHGSVTTNGVKMQSVANYSCDTGYVIRGNRKRICRADKNWHPHPPQCERIPCSPPLSPLNGQYTYTSLSHRNEYETEIQYSCNIGYRLDGNSSTACDYTGSWGKQPSCFDIKCAQPPTTRPNAERSGISYERGNLLLPESTVHYQCRQNFKISGHGEVFHDITSVCQYSDEAKMSTWNPDLHTVECEEIFCDRPPSDQNHLLESVKQSYRVGETITVTCQEGYGFSLPKFVDTVTCTDSGDWD